MTTAMRIELRIRWLLWEAAVGPPSPTALCAAVEAELDVLLGNLPEGDPPGLATPTDPALTACARRIAGAVHEALRAGQPPGPQYDSTRLDPSPVPDTQPASDPLPMAGAPAS